MKKLVITILIIPMYLAAFAQCLGKQVGFSLDNSIDTVILEGICGNIYGSNGTVLLNPKDFDYEKRDNWFDINCAFAKNCGQGAYLTVQANENSIKVNDYVVDTGEVLTCQDYDELVFTFPLPPSGVFHINICGFDTIVSVTTLVTDLISHNISIYPNPFTDHITVEFKENLDCKFFEIIDMQGQTQISEYSTKDIYPIDLSKLSVGIYFIRIQDSNTKEILKIDKIIKE
ncbi:MAG TPA: hypothetical protein DCQ26_07735 [Marinilabiliales bacterium]|nr:MAG: hypothetical protein A2W84_16255 [Bacteroidetes bacterium GWC2_40_13]OFX71925.1 MAG: hypothetical protein A2W96_06745 [Bacteroidetes bacterium GWD2_40_43]OFX94722.1 MAG: hypothetical protein A2W97_18550 [Bacteroidetes bacterium GWE2_40_63]OFY24749.1 MAG: hypothetical protein A2W88_16765 [Bacteroidetes bacterium GWF2_40_13]OFZ24485.1 MAG: hypothetical protein A2437_18680 [Bacteroidetes bacterium RIFOXYC2_FULL_40_12]HAM98489.1 hypothetical protein [Marinilabiliales bacterium]